MQEIEQLKQEIKGFEVEIAKLQAQLLAAGGRTLQLAMGESASDISQFVQAEAKRIVEQQPVLQGLKNALSVLASRLVEKQAQLQELEAVELKKHRQDRITEGQSKIRAKFSDVQKAAESLQNLYFDLKALALQYEADFSQINPPTSGGTVLNRNSLLNYDYLSLPRIFEEGARFVLRCEAIDLFQAEKEAFQRQQAEEWQVYRELREAERAASRQRDMDEKLRIEMQDRTALLKHKKSQLAEFNQARSERLAALKTANVGGIDSVIAKLEAEIEKLEKPMQTQNGGTLAG